MTKYTKPIVLLFLLQLCGLIGYCQITVTTSNTASVCYNTGSLTVNASGGTAPYTYKITAGPSNPNITYPIVLPAGQNTFPDLPSGTFTIVVTDASGNTGTFTAPVAGTYQFPFIVINSNGSAGISGVASGGLPPYQYAISSAGANSGFGPYQSSASFADLCPGQYWLRVRDSCQNIFTNVIAYSYTYGYNIVCANYSKGTLNISATVGHAPYTYSFEGQTSTTGSFTGLPQYYAGTLTITDSCGVQKTVVLSPPVTHINILCPYDSNYYLNGLSTFDTLTFICSNCSPVQTTVIDGPIGRRDTIFQHMSANQTYDITILNSKCGGDTLPYAIVQTIPTVSALSETFLSCNSFKLTSTPIALDSAILIGPSGNIVEISHTGYFFDLPPGTYTIKAYTDTANHIIYPCYADSATTRLLLPNFPGTCTSVMMDSACQLQYAISLEEFSPFRTEAFSVIYANGDTVAGLPRHISSTQRDICFYGLDPDSSYTLVSDSGCFETLTMQPPPVITLTTVANVPCVGSPTLIVRFTTNDVLANCGYYYLTLNANDSMVDSVSFIHAFVDDSATFTLNDTGWYTVGLYAVSFDTSGHALPYDPVCPLDTALVYISDSHVPFLSPNTAYTCDPGSGDQVIYQIYGGEIPYTVEIPGYDTVILNTNSGVFPTYASGQYTMIVYDNCGISSSLTFSIIDTCTPVVCAIVSAGPDTTICKGQSAILHAAATESGGTFIWSPGADSSASVTVSPPVSTSYIVTYLMSHCPAVSDTLSVVVLPGTAVSTFDTAICTGQSVNLTGTGTPAGGTYIWSPGADSTATITVSPQTTSTYTVTYSIGSCPAATDSSTVTVDSPPVVNIAVHYAICYEPDGWLAAIASGGSPPYSYLWSDVQHTTADTVSGLLPGTGYTVTVSDQDRCRSTASAQVADSMEPLDVVQDSLANMSCYGINDGYISVQVLNSTHCSYQWSPVSGDSVISQLGPGTYSLTVTDPVGCTDTISFTITQPPPVSLGITPADSTIQEGDSLFFYSVLTPHPSGSVSYDWSPTEGLSCSTCAMPVFNSSAGNYRYTLIVTYNGICTVSDTVTVKVFNAHLIYVPNAFTPNCDGINDVFYTYPIGARYFSLKIFDRWGEKVFESGDQGTGWDGSYRGVSMAPGIYVYHLDVTFDDNYTTHDQGSITLIK